VQAPARIRRLPATSDRDRPIPAPGVLVTYGTSFFLIAVGAILRFAVTASTSGFDLHTAGTILMVVGIVGLALSLLRDLVYGRRRRADVLVERPVVREDPRVRR
jgi:hypothetical protein